MVVGGGLISTQPECVIRGDLSDLPKFQASSFSSSPFHIAAAEVLFQTTWTKNSPTNIMVKDSVASATAAPTPGDLHQPGGGTHGLGGAPPEPETGAK